jgi:hypothetical protein
MLASALVTSHKQFQGGAFMTVRKYQNLREGVIALAILAIVFIVVYALQPQ